MGVVNREKLLTWMQSPIPRNIALVEFSLTEAKRQGRKPFYIIFTIGLVSLLVANFTVIWVEEFIETQEIILMLLYGIATIYMLPIYFFYYRSKKRILNLIMRGEFIKAKVQKMFQNHAKTTCTINFKYTATNGKIWVGVTNFYSQNSEIKIGDLIPILSHSKCGRMAFILTPIQGLMLTHIKSANEKTWIRWIIISLGVLLFIALPIIAAQLVIFVLIMQSLFG